MDCSGAEVNRINLYDRMFEQLCEAGIERECAVDTVVEAYLDGKPTTKGKRKYGRHERDSAFWLSRLIGQLPLEAWSSEPLVLALSRYLGQERVANPSLIERIAKDSPSTLERAVRWSGLVLRQNSLRRTELDRIALSNADIAGLCRVLDLFDDAFRLRVAAVERWRGGLAELTPFELLIYASLYAFEHWVPKSFAQPRIPRETRNETQERWDAIDDLLIWKLETASSAMFRLNERNLARSLKIHLSPYLFPSPEGERPRNDLRAAFEAAVAAQVELNSFKSRSVDPFNFDDSIAFVRKGEVLEIVVRDPASRDAWERDGRKLDRLHGYWFYRAVDEFIHRGLAERTMGRPENHEANRMAYIKAIRTQLRLTEIYGLDETVTTETQQAVSLFQALLASELMNAFYQQDFLQVFVSYANRLGHWLPALSRLALEGLANGSQNRFPLTWSDRKAKISKIVGWTVCEAFPRGSHAMAAAVLDFWTSDLTALAERLKKGTPGLEPTLCERPILKIGQQLIELPWMFGLQNNSTAAINNLRRLGARRGEARLETRRIEERLGNQLESRGFRVVLNWLPEDDARAGEVDLICALEQTVLVMEVKSTFMRQSQRDAWLHRTTTLRKAGQQVRDKVAAVRRALARNDALAQKLGIRGASDPLTPLTMHGWIVDTSIECDHQRFSGFLKVSLEEVLIALRDDHYLLNDPEGIFSGRFLEPGFAPPENPRQQATLYPSGFSASQFIRVIEQELVWRERDRVDRALLQVL
ncbi:MAG: hypothetical protein JNJ76_01785 [Candidatus Competibacter sp.]|nr:hypothetical protein [Candidatus Competibacter sp.]